MRIKLLLGIVATVALLAPVYWASVALSPEELEAVERAMAR